MGTEKNASHTPELNVEGHDMFSSFLNSPVRTVYMKPKATQAYP